MVPKISNYVNAFSSSKLVHNENTVPNKTHAKFLSRLIFKGLLTRKEHHLNQTAVCFLFISFLKVRNCFVLLLYVSVTAKGKKSTRTATQSYFLQRLQGRPVFLTNKVEYNNLPGGMRKHMYGFSIFGVCQFVTNSCVQ